MVIYFADRNLNILANASTSLLSGAHIIDDTLEESIENGVSTYSAIIRDDENIGLNKMATTGNYILLSTGMYDTEQSTYDGLFQIIESSYSAADKTVSIYAEDLGLDLINRVSPQATLVNQTLVQMLNYFKPEGWTVRNMSSRTGALSNEWSGENSTKERLDSVADLFDTEIYYSYTIDRFSVTNKYINVIDKRGSKETVNIFRYPKDIRNITTTDTVTNLATALSVAGGEYEETPINLVGYSYTYTDTETGDVYSVDTATGQMRNTSAMNRWASKIDSDGLILKTFEYDVSSIYETSAATAKATLAGEARAKLQEISKKEINYEIELYEAPKGIRIGDTVNIVNDDDELYLEARVLILSTSFAANQSTLTLGNFIIKEAGIDTVLFDKLKTLVKDGKDGKDGEDGAASAICIINSTNGTYFRNSQISTSLRVTVFYNSLEITTVQALQHYFGNTATLKWYDANNTLVHTGFEWNNYTSQSRAVSLTVKLEV